MKIEAQNADLEMNHESSADTIQLPLFVKSLQGESNNTKNQAARPLPLAKVARNRPPTNCSDEVGYFTLQRDSMQTLNTHSQDLECIIPQHPQVSIVGIKNLT